MEEIEKLLKKNPHIHYFRQDAKEFLFRLFTSRKKETKPKRVLIISDHPIFRKGTKSIIEGDNRFKWIAESGNGHRAIELTQRHQPDLVVVDISLPDITSIQLAREIRKVSPKTRVMILSIHSKIDYIAEAFQVGAIGYMSKGFVAERLLQGLDCISEGNYFLNNSSSDIEYSSLTPREQQIMQMLAEGLSSKKIAEQLSIRPQTVNKHRANIMKKLGLTKMELARYIVKIGLTDANQG